MPRYAFARVVVLGALCLYIPATWAGNWVLPYQDGNKWVAASDNASLIAVMRSARQGTHHFKVKLPTDNRDLSMARLEVLRDLLAREAKRGIVIEEIDGPAAAETIWISDK